MCNCIKETTKTASKHIVEKIEKETNVAEWLNKGIFDNVGYSPNGGSKIGMPFIVNYRRRKSNGEPEKNVTTKHTFIYPTYCPFCGEKC